MCWLTYYANEAPYSTLTCVNKNVLDFSNCHIVTTIFLSYCLPYRMNSREREITFLATLNGKTLFSKNVLTPPPATCGSGGCAFSAGCSKSGKAKCKQFIFFIMLQCSECIAHLSKCTSDLKQNGTQERKHSLALFFMPYHKV